MFSFFVFLFSSLLIWTSTYKGKHAVFYFLCLILLNTICFGISILMQLVEFLYNSWITFHFNICIIFHILFFHSSDDGHLDWVHIFVVLDSSAAATVRQISVWYNMFLLFSISLEVEFLDHTKSAPGFKEISVLFSSVTALICLFPNSVYDFPILPHPCVHLLFFGG